MPVSNSQHLFGNSLVTFGRGGADANIAVHIDALAESTGDSYAASGGWGFLRNHADSAEPRNNWSFQDVDVAWDGEVEPFADADIDSVMIAVANFIQDQTPDSNYAGDTRSPIDATLDIIADVRADHPEATIYIYEPWSRLGEFSSNIPTTNNADMDRYYANNTGAYHDWYVDFMDQIAEADPSADAVLIPVAPVMSELLTGPLAAITPNELYVDLAPHGTDTIYFLAGLISYTTIYGQQAPDDFDVPDGVHPLVQENFAEIAAQVADGVERYSNVDVTDDVADPVDPADPADPDTGDADPAAEADTAAVAVGETVRIDVLANDGGGALAYIDPPVNGTARIVEGQIEYTAPAGFTGTDTLTYINEVAPGVYEETEVQIEVGGDGDAPDPAPVPEPGPDPDPEPEPSPEPGPAPDPDDVDPANLVATPGQALTLDPQAMGAPAGTTLTYVDQPAQGTASIEDGLLIYRPDADATGTEELSFTVQSAGGAFTEITLNVGLSDDAPAPEVPVAEIDAPDAPVVEVVLDDDADAEPEGTWLDALTRVETSQFDVSAAGEYTLNVTADQGFTLAIDGDPVMASPVGSTAETLVLGPGSYEMTIATQPDAPASVDFDGPAEVNQTEGAVRAATVTDALPWVPMDEDVPDEDEDALEGALI